MASEGRHSTSRGKTVGDERKRQAGEAPSRSYGYPAQSTWCKVSKRKKLASISLLS